MSLFWDAFDLARAPGTPLAPLIADRPMEAVGPSAWGYRARQQLWQSHWTDGQTAPAPVAEEGEQPHHKPLPTGWHDADGDSGQALIFNFILLPSAPPHL